MHDSISQELFHGYTSYFPSKQIPVDRDSAVLSQPIREFGVTVSGIVPGRGVCISICREVTAGLW